MERASVDPISSPGSFGRFDAFHARNTRLAFGTETRRRGQKFATVPARQVRVQSSTTSTWNSWNAYNIDRHTDITNEFERLKANVLKGASTQRIQPRELLKGSVLKPLLLSMALMFLQQFSGINSVIYFTVFIFQSSGSTLDNNLSTIIVGIVQLIATIASMFLVDRAGRRMLLLFSG